MNESELNYMIGQLIKIAELCDNWKMRQDEEDELQQLIYAWKNEQ